VYAVTPVATSVRSPLTNITGRPVKGVTSKDLLRVVREVGWARGMGLSDRDVPDFSFEAFVDDLETVVDEYGLQRFALLGISQGVPVSIAYAVRHPERVSRLVLCGGFAKGWRKRGNAADVARAEASVTLIREGWGQDNPAARQMFTSLIVPDATHEEMQWFNELERISASADTAIRLLRVLGDIDVTELLPQVEVPTLVFHSRGDARVPFEHGLTLARGIPKARLVALESKNHLILAHEPAWPRFINEMCEFLTDGCGVIRTVVFAPIRDAVYLIRGVQEKLKRFAAMTC
jgi:pimeloyl-ACP methyl ester carboxylesterase